MNRNRNTNGNTNGNTRTRTIARLAAAIGAGVVTFGAAGSAFADSPVQPIDALDIAPAPACTPWSNDGFDWNFTAQGQNSWMFQIGYQDAVNTCDEFVALKIYALASATASVDDPGSHMTYSGSYPLQKTEDDTELLGLHDWAASKPNECSEFRLTVGGQQILAERFTDGCTPLDLSNGPEVGPDPTFPQNPGDLTNGDPEPTDPDRPDDLTNGDPEPTDPDRPDDFTAPTTTDPGNPGDLTNGDPGDPGDGGDDDGGQGGDGGQGTEGGELPHTGASSGTMIALAAGLSGLGALVLFGTRRRGATA